MLDLSDVFNISFVAGTGVLSLFFLIATIVIAAKGKRKCNAFDVILRILSALVFAAATVMLACSVLSMLSGSVCIALSGAGGGDGVSATLVFFETSVELPFAKLFVMLASTVGLALAAVLFIVSLAALIVDCLVANKKDVKPAKSVEQLKREAEIARIRKLGEAAVQKTAHVAEAEKSAEDRYAADDSDTEESDWRSESEKSPTEFVGISENSDDGFDTFDDSDNAEQNISAPVAEDSTDDIAAAPNDDAVEQTLTEQAEETAEQTPTEDVAEAATENNAERDVEEQTAVKDEDPVEETEKEQTAEAVAEKEEIYDDIEPDRGIYIPEIRTIVKPADEEAEPEVKPTVKKTAPSAAKKPTAKKAAETAQKPKKTSAAKSASSATKPAAKKPTATQRQTAATADKNEESTEVKKLPVTRRYVILDRRNAVNMFGDYLKERSQAEKEKLKSSINTIIIE